MTPIETICTTAIIITSLIVLYLNFNPPHRHKWKTTNTEKIGVYEFHESPNPYKTKKTITLTCTSCGKVKFVTTTL